MSGGDFLTKASRFIRRIRLLYNLYFLLKKQYKGFIKSIILYKLAIFLASLSSSFILAVFNKTLVIFIKLLLSPGI